MQEYWSGFPFPAPVGHVLSEVSTITCPFWVTLHGMARRLSYTSPSPHHRLNAHEFEQTSGDSEGQGRLTLQSMGSQRVRHDLETKQEGQKVYYCIVHATRSDWCVL